MINKYRVLKAGFLGPTHLRDISVLIPNEFASKIDATYDNSLEWMRMIQTKEGNNKFEVKYYGDRHENDFITFTEEAQEKVVAIDIKTGKEYLLFDAYLHGLSAVLINDYRKELKKERPLDNWFVSTSESKVFYLFVYAVYNNTREKLEQNVDQEGDYVMPDGGETDLETAIANGFDGFAIFGLDEQDNWVEILNAEELENR